QQQQLQPTPSSTIPTITLFWLALALMLAQSADHYERERPSIFTIIDTSLQLLSPLPRRHFGLKDRSTRSGLTVARERGRGVKGRGDRRKKFQMSGKESG